MASNISQDKFFNIQSNPNLDAADTGVDSSGKILSKEERKAIFRRRRINPKKVFGGSGAIVKVDKSPSKTPMGALIKSVSNIQNTVQRITNFIATDAKKEKEQQRQDQRDQFVQDDKDRKKKKEGLLEGIGKSIGKSLLKPVEAVGKNVKGILGRLGDAFMAIFGGFIANKGIKMIQAKMSGDTDTFKKMRNEMIKGLAIVGGIFLALNGGLLALPLIIKGVALAVIKIGAAILAFLASPAGLIALGIAAGIGVLFALKKGVDAGKVKAAGGQAFYDKFEEMKGPLVDAGITIKGTGKNEKFYLGKSNSRGSGQKTVEKSGSPEQKEIVANYIVERDKVIAIRDNMREDMETAESKLRKESGGGRSGSKKLQDSGAIGKAKAEIREKYESQIDGVDKDPKINSNTKNKDVKINSNSKKNGVTTLDEPKTQVIDTTTTSGGGVGNSTNARGSGKAASGLPNISPSNRDNNHVVYSQTQYNIMGV